MSNDARQTDSHHVTSYACTEPLFPSESRKTWWSFAYSQLGGGEGERDEGIEIDFPLPQSLIDSTDFSAICTQGILRMGSLSPT